MRITRITVSVIVALSIASAAAYAQEAFKGEVVTRFTKPMSPITLVGEQSYNLRLSGRIIALAPTWMIDRLL
jgi:hypothetical protein